MIPTPEELRACAALMEDPSMRWEWQHPYMENWIPNGSIWGHGDPWSSLKEGCRIRIHPDHQPKPEPRWTISATVPTLLIYSDGDGATKFGAIHKKDEEHIWFTNFAIEYMLDKSTGEVTRLDP